jgi:putative (di)nucleoside polyphosphate hydrolase
MKMTNRQPVDPETLPYRRCVGVVLFNGEGRVWAGRRIAAADSEMAGTDNLWQFPQGGIDKGEEPLEAAKRELYEETGVKTASLMSEAPDWINYDLPRNLVGIALKGRFRGQTQKWFAFRFEGNEDEIAINPPPGGHEAEFDDWAWRRLDEMPELIVPFKRGVYDKIVAAFKAFAA